MMADGGMADATPDEGGRGYTITDAIHKVKIPALPKKRGRTGHPRPAGPSFCRLNPLNYLY